MDKWYSWSFPDYVTQVFNYRPYRVEPPRDQYQINFYWNCVLNTLKSSDFLLQLLVAVTLSTLGLPVVYYFFKYVLLKLGIRLWNFNIPALFHNNYVQLQLPELFEEGNDITDWLMQFDLYCTANHLTDDKLKKQILLTRLAHDTRHLVKSRLKENDSFANLKKLMKTLFEPNELTLAQHMRNFTTCKQSRCDNIQKYYTALCRLAKLALPKVANEQYEEAVASQFLDGLSNPALQNKLLIDRTTKMK